MLTSPSLRGQLPARGLLYQRPTRASWLVGAPAVHVVTPHCVDAVTRRKRCRSSFFAGNSPSRAPVRACALCRPSRVNLHAMACLHSGTGPRPATAARARWWRQSEWTIVVLVPTRQKGSRSARTTVGATDAAGRRSGVAQPAGAARQALPESVGTAAAGKAGEQTAPRPRWRSEVHVGEHQQLSRRAAARAWSLMPPPAR